MTADQALAKAATILSDLETYRGRWATSIIEAQTAVAAELLRYADLKMRQNA